MLIPLFNKYFKLSEFDDPDAPGSGEEYMDHEFLNGIALARHLAGVPFRITSGYRTENTQNRLTNEGKSTSSNSPHLRGVAADIAVADSRQRYRIQMALQQVGFHRLGIGKSFIHVDNDTHPDKRGELLWVYDY